MGSWREGKKKMACHRLISDASVNNHSSRIPRPRLVARASLTELKAWDGKSASMKSGCSRAMDSSCSLFNKRFVWETFRRGHSWQLKIFNCTERQEKKKLMKHIPLQCCDWLLSNLGCWLATLALLQDKCPDFVSPSISNIESGFLA